jgi:hypothetical protein
MGTEPEVTELPHTTRGIVLHYVKLVARFSLIATSLGVVLVAALLGIGSLVAQRSLFTAPTLQKFALPLLAYNGSLFLLALPYLVIRAMSRRGHGR